VDDQAALMTALVASAVTSYFMNKLGVVMDRTMIQNIVETDAGEALDLVNPGILLYVLLLGLLPAILVYWIPLDYTTWRRELFRRSRALVASFVVIVLAMFAFSANYASMFREHKPLRYYANPVFLVYSIGKYVSLRVASTQAGPVQPLGLDARISATDTTRELIILVIGETVRADHMSLNGYGPVTNPLLGAEDVISFRNVTSCGTTTAISLPCMFSHLGRRQFASGVADASENVLDVLRRAEVNVLWRENNSGSKGLADRVRYEDFRSPETNPVCDIECRDIGMLSGLQEHIDGVQEQDILIVLHQMGNHGPAYFKRYPEAFEHFRPVCNSAELHECSETEIHNAYDNALRYTDYFLWNAIELLKRNDDRFETALVYFSDHGESLGESHLYLHGLPFAFAPEEQTHVAALMWFGEEFEIDRAAVRERADEQFSHDHLFHSLLGLMEIETELYDHELDILAGSRPADGG
jgi:lipid A ethanolaminephosphotransferase